MNISGRIFFLIYLNCRRLHTLRNNAPNNDLTSSRQILTLYSQL